MVLPIWCTSVGYVFVTRGVQYGDYDFAGTMLLVLWAGFLLGSTALVRHHAPLAKLIVLFGCLVVAPSAAYCAVDATMTFDRVFNALLALGVVMATGGLLRMKVPKI